MSVAKHGWEAEVLILDQRERARVARQAHSAEVKAAVAEAVAEERAAIVAWLRGYVSGLEFDAWDASDAIEGGAHHE